MLMAVSAALSRFVPSDAGGWSVTDPGIVLPTWPIHLDNRRCQPTLGYWEREFLVEDRLLFRDLAARERPVGTLQTKPPACWPAVHDTEKSFAHWVCR